MRIKLRLPEFVRHYGPLHLSGEQDGKEVCENCFISCLQHAAGCDAMFWNELCANHFLKGVHRH